MNLDLLEKAAEEAAAAPGGDDNLVDSEKVLIVQCNTATTTIRIIAIMLNLACLSIQLLIFYLRCLVMIF